MYKTNAIEIEQKIRRITLVEGPDDGFVNALWAKMEKKYIPAASKTPLSFWRKHPGWVAAAIALVLVAAIFIGFGPQKVSAFIRQIFGFSDSGLQAVQEAGLVTDLDISSEPTIVNEPTSKEPPEVYALGLSQTLADVTLTLDWAYVDEGRLALAFTTTDLPAGLAYGTPEINIDGYTPPYQDGSIQALRSDANRMMFVAYPLIQVDAAGEQINLSVDVPLVDPAEIDLAPVAMFHFEPQTVPVHRGFNLPLRQTYAAARDNVEVRLESVRMMPSFTEVTVCYDFPTEEAPFWYLQNATLQIGAGPEENYQSYRYLDEIVDDHCAVLGFGTGSAAAAGVSRAVLRVNKLVVPLEAEDKMPAERIVAANELLAEYGIEIAPAPAGQSDEPGGWVFVGDPPYTMDPAEDPHTLVRQALEQSLIGPWTFYIDLPDPAAINPEESNAPEPTPAPTPVGSQTQADVTITLDWVFVDALRAGVGYTITGLPDVPEATGVMGEVALYDAQGNLVGGSGVGSSEIERVTDQPGALQGTWSVGFLTPLTEAEAQFRLEITLGGNDMMNYIAGFPYDPEATPFPPGEFPPQLPEGFIGTYSFDFSAPVHPLRVLDSAQPVTVNGTEVLVPRAEVTASMSKVMICYEKPTERDWWIWNASLRNGTEESPMIGGGVLYDTDYELKPNSSVDQSAWAIPPAFQQVEHGRCLLLNFLQGQSDPASEWVLTIEALEISPPEVYPEAELAAAREILKQQGIEMVYETWQSGGGSGGSGATFTSLPEGMTWETAHQKFMEALGYVHAGPWEITLSSTP